MCVYSVLEIARTKPRRRQNDERDASVIANQAKEIFYWPIESRRLYDTYFYTVVLSGNTRVVQNVVEYMKNSGMKDVLDWLLHRTNRPPDEHKNLITEILSKITTILCLVWMLFMMATPFDYIINKAERSMALEEERGIFKSIPLPLVYAICSHKKDMWKYFLSQHVSLTDCDSKGNNIFHYIAEMSVESPDQAVKLFKMLIELINDMDSVKTLVLDKTNAAGLSALEYVDKYGSPSLITEALQYPDLLCHTILTGKDNDLIIKDKRVPSKGRANLFDTRIDHVDVSRYECGKSEHQSFILNLLSDRWCKMSSDGLKIFQQTTLVGKWVVMKVDQKMPCIIILNLFDLFLTACIFLTVMLYAPKKLNDNRLNMG